MDMKFQALPQHESLTLANPNANPDPSPQSTAEATPKQVAVALDSVRIGDLGFRYFGSRQTRLIADIRLGADRLLEALFVAAQPHQSSKPLNLFINEDASMRQHLHDLRSIDGAVVAYAWKRQLAGQAGASAVDRTRLALTLMMD
ncbi:hypothetical protein LWI29_032799 [Acer saccharum]|uniref:Uncharacterized protein n=1 Tax=Acer saccharum TaxID=4024 RepID=A0AA39SAW6_ACESA|nr:hypothetical protein LWI29_032799 [Acer saccharum]KAK1564813.1 hypothetical protein Q3G72_012172 [Acer saccharum]